MMSSALAIALAVGIPPIVTGCIALYVQIRCTRAQGSSSHSSNASMQAHLLLQEDMQFKHIITGLLEPQ